MHDRLYLRQVYTKAANFNLTIVAPDEDEGPGLALASKVAGPVRTGSWNRRERIRHESRGGVRRV
jgi:hypothetical protein